MNLSNVELPSNKRFGYFFVAIFLAAAIYFYIFSDFLSPTPFFSLGSILLAITLINADLLLPLNQLWMRFGLLLGMIISPIVLGILFFILISPLSILMRIVGRDELKLKPKKDSSYWIIRESFSTSNEVFKNQF